MIVLLRVIEILRFHIVLKVHNLDKTSIFGNTPCWSTLSILLSLRNDFNCIWLLIIFCSCIESFIISPSPGPGNVRAEFLAYVTESLTRGPGMYIIYIYDW